MQTEKSQPSGQRIMPETRLTSFPALSVNPLVGILRSASETDDKFYLSKKANKKSQNCLGLRNLWKNNEGIHLNVSKIEDKTV